MRERDELILSILAYRRDHTNAATARKFQLTPARVRAICAEIRDADIGDPDELVLHYPQT